MRLSIFARMVIGYLAIFIPVTAVSIYALSQLTLFHKVTGDILHIDHRMRDCENKIVDLILTQVGYDRKYVITKDRELYDQFLIAERDLKNRFEEAVSMADTADKMEVLARIQDGYARYRALFDQETTYLKNHQAYLQDQYEEKKRETVDELLWELSNFKYRIEQDTYEKVKSLGESGTKTSPMVMAMGAGFIVAGILISILITRSITKPLSLMREKTREVANGDFEGSLGLTSPPEIKELAQDFDLMCNKLKATDKMKSEFFSLMAHELRTPLASIKEGTNLLLDGIGGGLEEKQKMVLTIMAEESHHLIDLVNSLLDLSKMEAGMMELHIQPSDLGPLIRRAVSGMEPLAMAKNLSVQIEISQDMPSVRMDEDRVLQALRNLTGNAVKFTPEGGHIAISARAVEEGIAVSVADSGPGIPQEDLTAIFDKFKQTTITNYRKLKGTGLGLAIVKRIINAHGGRVWVESEAGQGSTFIFLLPV